MIKIMTFYFPDGQDVPLTVSLPPPLLDAGGQFRGEADDGGPATHPGCSTRYT